MDTSTVKGSGEVDLAFLIADLSGYTALTETPVGAVRLRNVTEPVRIYEVILRGQRDPGRAVDPVCRMQMRGEAATARLPYGRMTYFFCSFECAKAFAQQPDRYASATVMAD